VSPNYTANCTTTTATIDVHEITGKKVTSGKERKRKRSFSVLREREGEKDRLGRERAENKENVKCQVQIPIQVPRVF
jgi:hypothetical protein